MLEIRQISEGKAPKPKKAFLLSGAFGPYTIGHEEAARQAASYAAKTGHTHLYHGIGSSAGTKDAPLTHAQKTKVIKSSHRLIKKDVKGIKYGVLSKEHDNPFKQVLHLAKTGHRQITLGLGSDQMSKKGLRGSLERHVQQHGGMKDKEGNVHPVKLSFKQMGEKRNEGPLHRKELVSRLSKGDLTVAKAGHLRKAVSSGDTELAHALMPASVNKPRYFNLIKKQQKKIGKKKLAEGVMSFLYFIGEDIELIPVRRARFPEKPRKAEDVHKGYATKDYSNEKIVTKKNLGEIHPGYDLHHHARIAKDHRGRDVLRHQFTIVHKASGDVAGEMNAKGGKLHPTKGVVPGPKGKGLRVTHLEVHPDHSSKKLGKSLAVEMYRHLHRRGHAIQSDTIQSHGAAHVWNTMRHDPELKKHMMIHSNREPLRGELHTFEKRAHRRPERHIWYQHSHNWSGGREKVEGSRGDEPDEVKTLVLSGKKRRKIKEDIEMANILMKPHGGYHRDFTKLVQGRNIKPTRSGRIAKGYSLHTSKDSEDPNIETHYIVHDATNHVAGEVTTRSSPMTAEHSVIHTDIHGDHTQKKIGKSLAVLAYKHLARKKGNLHSSNLQSPGGASIWNRLRKDPRMKGKIFHKLSHNGQEVPAHDVPDKKIWASDVKIQGSKSTPGYLPPSKHHAGEHDNVLRSRLVIRPAKKS